MDTKFAIPVKYQKLFFQFKPPHLRRDIKSSVVLGLLSFSIIISCVGINTPNQNFKISNNKITIETVEFEIIGISEGKAEGQFTIYKGFFNKKIVSSNTILINLKSKTAELTSYKDWVDGMATKVDVLQYKDCKVYK